MDSDSVNSTEATPALTAYAFPGLLTEIALEISVETTIAVARCCGGRRLNIPKGPMKPDHPLVKAVGPEAAVRIAAVVGPGRHKIPSARAILNWHDARRMRDQNMTIAEIAAALRLDELHVSKLLRGARGRG